MPLKTTYCAPASSLMVKLLMGFKVGGWFTGLTVRRKDALAAAPLVSVRMRLMLAVPNWFGCGVMVTVRLAPLPPKTMLVFETNAGLDELVLSSKLVAGLSASLMRKARGAV